MADHLCEHHVGFQKWTLVRELGKGTYGRVSLYHDTENQVYYVVKVQRANHVGDREVFMHKRLIHDCPRSIGCMSHSWRDQNHNLYIAWKYDTRETVDQLQTLEQYWYQNHTPTWPDTLRVIKQLVEAVHHLHHKGVLHRDLKTENIMIDQRGQQAFVIDLGLSCLTTEEKSIHQCLPLSLRVYGNEAFIGPEFYHFGQRKKGQHLGQDVWALGEIILMLMTKTSDTYVAYCDQFDAKDMGLLMMHGFSKYWDQLKWREFSEKGAMRMREIIKSMLNVDITQRPTMGQVKTSVNMLE